MMEAIFNGLIFMAARTERRKHMDDTANLGPCASGFMCGFLGGQPTFFIF